MSTIQSADHADSRTEDEVEIEPRLVWSRVERAPRSFANLPTGSVAFRTWLGTLVILGIITILAAASAEAFGFSSAAMIVIGVFVVCVAALSCPSPKREPAKLRIVK